MMNNVDLVILHPPGIYDFRQEIILHAPISSFISSSPLFDQNPLELAAAADFLEKNGYRTRLINIGACMLADPAYNPEEVIAQLNPLAFVLDMQLLTHAQGTMALSQIIKAYHPETPVVLSGLSATYFHRELARYPQIDYIIRGDSLERSLLDLLECLQFQRVPDAVPNLTWKGRNSRPVYNDNLTAPGLADDWLMDYYSLPAESSPGGYGYPEYHVRCADYTFTPGLISRGCANNCLTCGFSSSAYGRFTGRSLPAYRSPEVMAQNVSRLKQVVRRPIFIIGDIAAAGMDYSYRFSSGIEKSAHAMFFDLFSPGIAKTYSDMAEKFPEYGLQLSIESHDPEIRRSAGKNFSNETLETSIGEAFDNGCKQINLHFKIGLPLQTGDSIQKSIEYAHHLLNLYPHQRVIPYFSTIAPFLEPGSRAYESPEKFGYRLLFKEFSEYRRALLQPSWKHSLNYETAWLTRDDIAEVTYTTQIALRQMLMERGIIDKETGDQQIKALKEGQFLIHEIDALIEKDRQNAIESLRSLKKRIDLANSIVNPALSHADPESYEQKGHYSTIRQRVLGCFGLSHHTGEDLKGDAFWQMPVRGKRTST